MSGSNNPWNNLCSLYATCNGNTTARSELVLRERYGYHRIVLFQPPINVKRADFGRFAQPSIRFQYLNINLVSNQELIYFHKR